MYYVYMAACRDGSLYTGICADVTARLREHNSGRGAKYTRGRGPLRLRYLEALPDKGGALRREMEIKRLKRAEKLRLAEKYEAAGGRDSGAAGGEDDGDGDDGGGNRDAGKEAGTIALPLLQE